MRYFMTIIKEILVEKLRPVFTCTRKRCIILGGFEADYFQAKYYVKPFIDV